MDQHDSGVSRRALLVATLTMCAAPLTVSAVAKEVSGRELLARFAQNIKSASGRFVQRTVAKDGKPVDAAMHGEFMFERPGRFVWSTLKPYAQDIVSDGQSVWIWDPDLNQVTVKRLNAAMGSTPAGVLFGYGNLAETLTLTDEKPAGGLVWVRARPIVDDPTYDSMRIGFDGDGKPAVMLLFDHFGQTTELRFTEVRINEAVDSKRFDFRIPEGADVLRDSN